MIQAIDRSTQGRYSRAMPRFHMHLKNAHFDHPDEEGVQLADIADARSNAIVGIRDVLSHEVREGKMDLRGKVDIKDDEGKVLLTVAFSVAINIIGR